MADGRNRRAGAALRNSSLNDDEVVACSDGAWRTRVGKARLKRPQQSAWREAGAAFIGVACFMGGELQRLIPSTPSRSIAAEMARIEP